MPVRDYLKDARGRFAGSLAGARANLSAPPAAPTAFLPPAPATDGPRDALQAALAAQLTDASSAAVRELTVVETWEGDRLVVIAKTPSCTVRAAEIEDGIWEAVATSRAAGDAAAVGGPFRTKAEARQWAEKAALDEHVSRAHAQVIDNALASLQAGTAKR